MKKMTYIGYFFLVLILFVFLASPGVLLAQVPGETEQPGENNGGDENTKKGSDKDTINAKGQLSIDGKVQTVEINLEYKIEKAKEAATFYTDCSEAVVNAYEALGKKWDGAVEDPRKALNEALAAAGEKALDLLCEAARDAIVDLIQKGASKVNEHFGGRNVVVFDPNPKDGGRNWNISLWEGIKSALDIELGSKPGTGA